MAYKILENNFMGEVTKVIIKTEVDGCVTSIPTDPANSDYQAYLATLASESANDSKGNK